MIILRCKKCNHIFPIEEIDNKYCIACNCKELEILENDSFDELQRFKNKERIESQKDNEEYKVLNKLQTLSEESNIKVWRECIPDQCVTWKYPYSVDMIFEIPNYGLIGLEGKNINTHGQGSKYAEAYLQIRDKYSDKTYFNGKKIRRWCVFANINSTYYKTDRVDSFVQYFFNKLGISYLRFEDKYFSIDAGTKNQLGISDNKFTGTDKDNFLDYGRDIK